MKWITRERARVDRIACPWLITRFIDPKPEFLFVPAPEVLAAAKREDAIPYDVPNVQVDFKRQEIGINVGFFDLDLA